MVNSKINSVENKGLFGLANDAKLTKGETAFATSIVLLDPKTIKDNPHQLRKAIIEEEFESLKENIEKSGMLQPPVVRKVINDYILIAGQRRLKAAIELDMQLVECKVVESSEQDAIFKTFEENFHRSDPTIMELAETMVYMKKVCKNEETGKSWNSKDLEIYFKKKRSTVTYYLGLVKNLTHEVKIKARSNRDITLRDLIEIAQEQDKDQQYSLYVDIVNERKEMAENPEKARVRKKRTQKKPKASNRPLHDMGSSNMKSGLKRYSQVYKDQTTNYNPEIINSALMDLKNSMLEMQDLTVKFNTLKKDNHE